MTKRSSGLCAVLLATTSLACGALGDFAEGVRMGDNGVYVEYRLYTPTQYDPSEQYPLMIYIHSSANSGTDNIGPCTHPNATAMLDWAKQDEHPAFLLVPQYSTGNYAGDTRTAHLGLVQEIIQDLQASYSLDPERTYVSGWSLGGHGATWLMAHHPEIIAAAAPMCGTVWSVTPEDLVDRPIWAFTGTQDTNTATRPAAVYPTIEASWALGGSAIYKEYPDGTHSTTPEMAYAEPGLMPWLWAQRLGQGHDTSMLIDPYRLGTDTVEIPAGEAKFLVHPALDGIVHVDAGGSLAAHRCSIEGQGILHVQAGRLEIVDELRIGNDQSGTLSITGAESRITVGRYDQRDDGTLVTTLGADGFSPILVAGAAQIDGHWTLVDDRAPVGVYDVLVAGQGIAGTFDGVVALGENWAWGVRGGTTLWAEKHTPLTLLGDANGDGDVSDSDYTIWADHYGQAGVPRSLGDFDGSGSVTEADYTLWADHYGQAFGGPAAEPATGLVMLLLAMAVPRDRLPVRSRPVVRDGRRTRGRGPFVHTTVGERP